jgi:hypothetical protein
MQGAQRCAVAGKAARVVITCRLRNGPALKLRRAGDKGVIQYPTRAASGERVLGGGQFQDLMGPLTAVLNLKTE